MCTYTWLEIMSNKLKISMILASLILLTLAPICSSSNDSQWWNKDWSFKQELSISIDTSTKYAKYQPIDIHIKFDNPCWAKNEKEHSVRVIYQDDSNFQELESQICDLNHTDEYHIKACNLVFLIPEMANGKERYFVYYDDAEKSGPDYPDHIDVEEAYYYFEPIPGLPFESSYFKITQDGFIAYGVAYQGEFLGTSTAQQITIFKEKTLQVSTPKDGEAYASFDYFYNYGPKTLDFYSTIQKLISKEIFIDGNLMVEFGITSETSISNFRTNATYKCYYCPAQNRRINVHVKHEALEESHAEPSKPACDSCGNIAGLQIGKVRSPSIGDLNFGRMFPFMHVYSENEMIQEYSLVMNPEYTPEGIRILDTSSDVDLGTKAWASFDEGKTGVAQALIFGSNSIITSGTDERDGIQIKAIEDAGPGLLGLETDAESFYLTRNSYEKGSQIDLTVPKDLVIEYDAEFFTTMTDGYVGVDKEACIFQSLIKNRPSNAKDVSETEKDMGNCSLTTYIHFAPSFPMGTTLTILTGKNISYITAELYRGEDSIMTDVTGRISLNSILTPESDKLLQKIKVALSIIDWKNFSFFKKVRFENLEPGTYLVKIYKENVPFEKERKFIGYKIVEVKGDTKTHVFCRPQGSIIVTVFDQNGRGIKDVNARLIFENATISKSVTSQDGKTTITAPCSLKDTYLLRLTYNGFIIDEENVKIKYSQSIFPIKKSIKIELYDLKLKTSDTWGLTPQFKIYPILTSTEMHEKTMMAPDSAEDGEYAFKNLSAAEYQLEINYKSYVLEKNIKIPGDGEEINIVLPVEFKTGIQTFNSRGMPLSGTTVVIFRAGKTIKGNSDEKGFVQFPLPAGDYEASIYLKDHLIGTRKINIISDSSFQLVTIEEPVFPLISALVIIVMMMTGAFFAFRKKDKIFFMKVLAISLALLALVSPWWMLEGSTNTIKTTTSIFLVPGNVIFTTATSDVIAGEISSESLPAIFTLGMNLLAIAIVAGCTLIILNMIFERLNKKKTAFLSLLLGAITLTGAFTVFFYAMSFVTKIGIGSFMGGGNINVNIIGEGLTETVPGSWGPSIGFYLCLISIIILLSILVLKIKKAIQNKIKKEGKLFDKR